MYYEDVIEALGTAIGNKDAIEAGMDAMAFVYALHQLYVESGVLNEDSEPDLGILENLIDAYHGELAAASLFLSQEQFKGVENILTSVSKVIEDNDTGKNVPTTVSKGFARFAKRVENARRVNAAYNPLLKIAEETSQNT